ncbi:hypothetical protein H4Q26_004562 [Puccinia striiformis f. sp. tritici PST-130]|nr:hypothetical protein H4Q26_004562 [Puccinia striiformis f. sp. tritici PST-130]
MMSRSSSRQTDIASSADTGVTNNDQQARHDMKVFQRRTRALSNRQPHLSKEVSMRTEHSMDGEMVIDESSIKAVSPSSACERTCCESKHVRYAPPFIRLMRYIPSAKFNLLPAAFLPFVGPRQIHFALASPQSNKSLIIRVNTPFFGPPLLPKQQASPLNPSYGAELTAQGLRQHLSHHRISSKSADHFPELLELFAECAEELPVARSHQDNPGIRRSARIRAIMDTPKEATGPSSRFNETHSTCKHHALVMYIK